MSIEPCGGHNDLERDVKVMLEWMRAICVSLKLSVRGLEAKVSNPITTTSVLDCCSQVKGGGGLLLNRAISAPLCVFF